MLYVTVKDDVYGVDGCVKSKWLNLNVTESSESCVGTLEMNGVKDRYCCIKTESDGNAFVLEAFSGGSHPEGVRIRYEDGKFVREQYP